MAGDVSLRRRNVIGVSGGWNMLNPDMFCAFNAVLTQAVARSAVLLHRCSPQLQQRLDSSSEQIQFQPPRRTEEKPENVFYASFAPQKSRRAL